jgi:hypothetical protein
MNLSVTLTNTATRLEPGTDLRAGASNPALSVAPDKPASDAAPALTISAVDPRDHTRLDQYLQALGAPLLMGAAASDIANALVPVMQSVIRERPDLAHAQFDFASSNGAISVTSNTLNDADKTWLQNKLNAHGALVQSVQSFHDHAVSGYETWANADGNPLSPAESDAVSKQADTLTGFMDLFRNLGASAQGYLMRDGTYRTPSGATLDLSQDPGSAAGFLNLMDSVRSAADGTATFTTSSGTTTYGVLRMNIFEMNSSAMPHFFPPSGTRSLGVHETA